MPELPEVETIVRSLRNPIGSHFSKDIQLTLRPGIIGRMIQDCQVLWERSIAFPSVNEFQNQIQKQKIIAVHRRGKFIVIELERQSLLIHLRMSGDILVQKENRDRNFKHDRVILNFDDKVRMVFNDPRKFGRVWLVDDPEIVTGSLGPEPFATELTPQSFFLKMQKAKRQIKSLLLDQSFLAGLGNIYTDEVLFKAGIHPSTLANSIDRDAAGILLLSIREVLEEGIRRNGASIDWVYRGGDFQNQLPSLSTCRKEMPALWIDH
ncbi:MAG: DNA-formamidopyrimidine glycosylase [Anaerolinea sp.]|nr:DNA-formamidopyrimidine glycosylase [Anaerolinea sp.]